MWLLLVQLALGAPTDRVVAVVDAEVVLSSDVAIAAEIREHTTGVHPFWNRADAPVEAALIRAAAGDLALYRPGPNDIQRRIQQLELEFGAAWQPFLSRWSMKPADLARLVRLRLLTEAWLIRNVTSARTDTAAFDPETTALLNGLDRRFRVRRVPEIP